MRNTLSKWLVLLIIVVLIIWASIHYRGQFNLRAIQATIQGYGVWAPLVFIGLYIAATILFLPGSVLTIAGGLIFGAYIGTAYNLIGAVIGSTGSFLIARYIASDWVQRKTGSGRMKQLMDGVEKEGWKFVAIVRLVPIIPFNLLNYALGLTPVRLLHYIIASAVFMLPGTFAYTYVGSLGEAFVHGGGKEIVTKVSIALGLLILLACIPWLVKRLRKNNLDSVPTKDK